MKRNLIILIISLFLSGCQTPPATVDPVIVQNTAQALANIIVAKTQAAWSSPTTAATATFLPTSTITNTPTNVATSTPSNTPTATMPPPPTIDVRYGSKDDGFYLVNIDIAPGVWRSTGTRDNCYWATTSKGGGINDNHFGMSGGTALITSGDFQVEFTGCGVWEYLGQ